MARRLPRTKATQEKMLVPSKVNCEQCGQLLWIAEHKHRTITTLDGVWKLISVIRWCNQSGCTNYHSRQHPEEERCLAPQRSKLGWDIIIKIGLMYAQDGLSASKICQSLQKSGINIAQRSITYWIHRYGEAWKYEKDSWYPSDQIKAKLRQQGQISLSIAIFPIDDYNLGIICNSSSGEMLLLCLLPKNDGTKLLQAELKIRLRRIEKFLSQIGVTVRSLIFNEDEILISSTKAVFPGVSCQVFLHRIH